MSEHAARWPSIVERFVRGDYWRRALERVRARRKERARREMERYQQHIRDAQVEAVLRVEAQLDAGLGMIPVGDRLVSREAAWATTRAIRECWARGIRYDRVLRLNGNWYCRGEASDGEPVAFVIGEYEGS